ncbi:MAG TPA: 16S rRNA (cytidine(1402)-2'-O)-methyltransferase [Ktedonobacterales bacterium]|jgi:16S rRNA (cytidine1402-2'-O)-methyltransferase|nr:16S rRNA (cytidine(1402)-2'-O)-methyltransferase [Ktedonobacterales bacterium]
MGTLYLVATPIGNLEDITLRALRVLREVSLIAAEDTRHTRKLLNHFNIPAHAISYHEHSPAARRDLIVAALATGDVALVSDAGTPAISDPGADLVRAALAAGYAVVPIPGPAAAVSALIASGLPTDTFTFLGFLPRKPTERRALLERVRAEPRTLVLYEAPHRLLECLDDLRAVLGDREIAVARELTKLHEAWLRGPISVVRARAAEGSGPRGEYTLVVAGATAGEERPGEGDEGDERPVEEVARARLRALLRDGARTGTAAARIAKELRLPKRVAYRLALNLAAEAGEEVPDCQGGK